MILVHLQTTKSKGHELQTSPRESIYKAFFQYFSKLKVARAELMFYVQEETEKRGRSKSSFLRFQKIS